MLAGEPTVRVFGQELAIKAEIISIEGLSAHADSEQLMDWLRTAERKPKHVFLNHGEPVAADLLRQRVDHELGLGCTVPLLGQMFELK